MKTKLIIESWRRFLREGNEKNYKGPPLNYSSVVLDDESVELLLSKIDELGIKDQIPNDFSSKSGSWPHHMTINMGPLLDGWNDDESFTLTVDGWGFVDSKDGKGKPTRAMAYRVKKEGMPSIKNEVAHITTLVPPDGKAFHSNKITDWNDISPFQVEGIVVAQTPQKKKQKKAPPKKKASQSPKDFAKGLADKGMSADRIKNIMSKKFPNIPAAALPNILKAAGIQ